VSRSTILPSDITSIQPPTLEGDGVRLDPLTSAHEAGLTLSAAGKLWELWFTAVPEPDKTARYIVDALVGCEAGHTLPWAVRNLATGEIAGSTRYHDVVAVIDHVKIGYTWHAAKWQRTHVNTACKLFLHSHAFDTITPAIV